MRKIKRITSIILAALMVMSLFAVVPITASATEETSTVTWDNNSLQKTSGGKSSGGVTLTTEQGQTRVNDCFYSGRGSATFKAPEGSVFTKIELKNAEYVNYLNFPGATVAQSGGYWDNMDPEDPYWIPYYTVTWTGESSEVTFSGAVYQIQSIVFTLKSVAPTTYTVTWKNWNGDVLEPDTGVESGATPTYDGAIPTKTADDSKHYTFSGWSNGTTTYGLTDTLPAVTADVTYTAQFTESAHSFNSNPVFNWTQDASTGDWNCNKLTLTCSDCDVTEDYDVAGFFGASAVTCTADAYGDFTYSVSKKVDGVTYSDTKTLEANSVIKSATQLKAAAKQGGSWELGADLTGVTDVQCANGFVLDGKGHTVTRHANVSTQAVFRTTTNPAEITLKNLTIDGIAGQSDSKPAIATKQSNPSNGNVINLENVTITNYDFDATNNGVVLAWGQATVNMKNCTVDTDSTYDVWGGAASTINVDGGKAGTVYLNGGTSSATVDNGAAVTVETSKPESVTVAPGYALNDNGDGTYTVVIDNSSPLNPFIISAADAKAQDKNLFGLDSSINYLKGTLLGVQVKDDSADPFTSENREQEAAEGKDLRFVAVLDYNLLKGAEDYGFVLAKVENTKTTTNTNFNGLQVGRGAGEKYISAKGTWNTVCGTSEEEMKYGNPDDDTTAYKYVTCAVNGIDTNKKIAIRFYYKKDGVTYYAKYAGHNYQYTGCTAGINAAGNVY